VIYCLSLLPGCVLFSSIEAAFSTNALVMCPSDEDGGYVLLFFTFICRQMCRISLADVFAQKIIYGVLEC